MINERSVPYVSGSRTSEAKARSSRKGLAAIRNRVLDYVTSKGISGATNAEIKEALHPVPHQSSTARVRDLVKDGFLVDSGHMIKGNIIWVSLEVVDSHGISYPDQFVTNVLSTWSETEMHLALERRSFSVGTLLYNDSIKLWNHEDVVQLHDTSLLARARRGITSRNLHIRWLSLAQERLRPLMPPERHSAKE